MLDKRPCSSKVGQDRGPISINASARRKKRSVKRKRRSTYHLALLTKIQDQIGVVATAGLKATLSISLSRHLSLRLLRLNN